MATIKDVAGKSGLSKTLVSRYLNNQKGVSPQSREKIIAAIKELNYRPNGLARSLVLQKTQTIGIVLDNLCSPFISNLISGLESGAEDFDKENKYNVIFCSSNGDMQKKQRHVQFLTQGRVDGIVIYGSLVTDDSIIKELASSTFPFILIENDVELDVNKVVIDNVDGAYRATEYLIQLGHKRIVHFAGNMNLKITLDRLNGYVRAMQDHLLPIDKDMIIYPDFSAIAEEEANDTEKNIWSNKTFYNAGYKEMHSLLSKNKCPDAVFFATDISAFGAIKAINEAGLSVPEDISVMGFDDARPQDYDCDCRPISTMRQPLKEAGYTGIKELIKTIQTPDKPHERTVLKTGLVIRDSCRKKA